MLEVSYFIVKCWYHGDDFAMVILGIKGINVTLRTEFCIDIFPSRVAIISLINIQICFTFNICCPSVGGHIHWYVLENEQIHFKWEMYVSLNILYSDYDSNVL